MNFTLALLGILLWVQICRAAESEVFYHLRAAEEIEATLNTNEIYSKLDLLNSDSRFFELTRSILDPGNITAYVVAQEKVSTLLHNNEHVDFKSAQMKTFAGYLLNSVENYPERFDDSKLYVIFSILFASGTVENSARIREILKNSIPRLKTIPRIKILKKLVAHASPEVCFIVPEIVKDSFLGTTHLENFLNDYINAAFASLTPATPEVLFMLFKIVSQSTVKLTNGSFELLLNSLRNSVSRLGNDDISYLMPRLEKLIDHFNDNRYLVEIVVDIILDESFISSMRPEELNPSFLSLIHKCSQGNAEYFQAAVVQVSPTTLDKLYYHTEKLQLFTKALMCMKHLTSLTENSPEVIFKLGLSSAKHLREIFKICPSVVTAIPNLTSFFRTVNLAIVDLVIDGRHEYNLLALEIMANLSLIDFEICRGDAIAGNVSYAIGHLIFYNKESSKLPEQLISEIKPNLDDIIKGTIATRKNTDLSITRNELSADLCIVKLHDSEILIREATEQLCYAFLISAPIKDCNYEYIKDMHFVDEMGILRAGFYHHLIKYKEHPVPSDVRHFKRYFDYLVQKGYFGKNEISIIRKFFRNFNLNK